MIETFLSSRMSSFLMTFLASSASRLTRSRAQQRSEPVVSATASAPCADSSSVMPVLRAATGCRYHFWQGKPGLWKTLLPAAEAAALAPALASDLSELGYVCDPEHCALMRDFPEKRLRMAQYELCPVRIHGSLDHALVISAGATPSDRAAGSAVPPSVSAPSAAEPRALLPERASDEPLPDKAAPVVGPAVDDQVSALFDTSASSPPREVDEASKKKSQNGSEKVDNFAIVVQGASRIRQSAVMADVFSIQ